MDLDEMKVIMREISQAYPNAFSASQKNSGVASRWLDHFGHLETAVIKSGARHLRENHNYPTIQNLWKSVLSVTGNNPPLHRIKMAVFDEEDIHHNDKMIQTIIMALGGQHDIENNLSSTEKEIMFARYAPEVLKEHQQRIMDEREELYL